MRYLTWRENVLCLLVGFGLGYLVLPHLSVPLVISLPFVIFTGAFVIELLRRRDHG